MIDVAGYRRVEQTTGGRSVVTLGEFQSRGVAPSRLKQGQRSSYGCDATHVVVD